MLFIVSLRLRLIACFCLFMFFRSCVPVGASEPILTVDEQKEFSEQDRLRGSVTAERKWWDLLHYDLSVTVDPSTKSIEGTNVVRFRVIEPAADMQIDLQPPLEIRNAQLGEVAVEFSRNGNVYLLDMPRNLPMGATFELTLHYGGRPTESKNPPWSGGFSWRKDASGKDFIATSCQGIGASIWWPCKDHGYDEPDQGVDIQITVPQGLTAVSNGRLVAQDVDEDNQTATFQWRVVNPINNYSINANIGDYVRFDDRFQGENGRLDMQYWVLRDNLDAASKHFKEAPRTIEAFEYWFGPYPFYEDSYKLVEVPYLGMEHQSSVTYGNGFRNGYRGTDLSGTGVGLKFDFIIVHESGHEWFGNNISMRDAADMWIHESFTNYSENLFVEYHFSQEEAEDYVIGCRKRIRNDSPIIGTYDVNQAGSGDMYYKGGNMLHTLRHMLNDTDQWRSILRGLNKQFWHQTVTTEQIETYLSEQTDLELEAFFDQYLRSTDIPIFEYQKADNALQYRFVDVVDGFTMPLRVILNGQERVLHPTSEWQILQAAEPIGNLEVNRNFYVLTREAQIEVENPEPNRDP